MQYRTIKNLSDLIRKQLWRIPHDIDLVIGLPRSGMLPASMIALYLNKRFTDVDSFVNGHIYGTGWTRTVYMKESPIKKVLVVDDSIYSGKSITQAKEKLVGFEDIEFIYFSVFSRSESSNFVDIYCEIIDDERIFEWNLFHHYKLASTCMDIDGVLCCDPEIDDDGEKYMDFLNTAKPLFIPTAPVDTLISCRLSKYRSQTENWLKCNNINYSNLVMLDLPNRETRIKWGKYGEFKGEYYRQSNDSLFIESSLFQAVTIAQISHKPVICIENNELIYYPDIQKTFKGRLQKRVPKLYAFLKSTKYTLCRTIKRLS